MRSGLLAYFSRASESYFSGGRRDLDVGNTEVLAPMIAELVDLEAHVSDHDTRPVAVATGASSGIGTAAAPPG
jgi:hypothetical protein